jgi:hypothetical protein
MAPAGSGRGSFTSVKEPAAAIGAFIDSWNDHPRPFAWTKDANEILASIDRAKTKANVLTPLVRVQTAGQNAGQTALTDPPRRLSLWGAAADGHYA